MSVEHLLQYEVEKLRWNEKQPCTLQRRRHIVWEKQHCMGNITYINAIIPKRQLLYLNSGP